LLTEQDNSILSGEHKNASETLEFYEEMSVAFGGRNGGDKFCFVLCSEEVSISFSFNYHIISFTKLLTTHYK
jgi:hypothetical protein